MFIAAITLRLMLCLFFGYVHGGNHNEDRQLSGNNLPTGPSQRLKIPFFCYQIDATTMEPFSLGFSVLVSDNSWDRYFCTFRIFEHKATASTEPLEGVCTHDYPEKQYYFLSVRLWQPLPQAAEKWKSWQYLRHSKGEPQLEGKFKMQLIVTDF